ncbi:hypothetical protein [Kaistia nematophila]|uniref:Saccharopine dehydrogenase NADP binding domain-containing protein n=1 Tax=Kaistia nematophila TaxID=2994654 RepID=A0A9X3E3T5_9HYPH|nr:hypothetical protein [Kaistia nematophila]MCX5570676.1 hypothetical protein [Kaistia nematophila]
MAGYLIVGGYGHVGQRIAARLVRAGVAGVRIAGRDGARARSTAAALGCEGAVIDMADPAGWDAALDGIGTVVVCIDLATADFPATVLGRGLAYIDISATDAVLARVEALDGLARRSGGSAVLSVGLAPGLTNLMALEVVADLDRPEGVTIGVLLGLGDAHGAAAVDWTLDNLQPLGPGEIVPVDFGVPGRAVPTIPFAFADQHVLMRRHGWPSVTTRLGFASPLIGASSLRLLSGLARRDWFRRLLRWSMARFRLGSDRTALAVEAVGKGGRRRRLALEGWAEAEITALIAARVALLLREAPRAGVHHIEELWALGDFARELAAEGIAVHAEGRGG